MPPVPLPPEVDDFLRQPNAAVVATLRPDGSPHTVATRYDWDGARALLNMDESRLRLRFMRALDVLPIVIGAVPFGLVFGAISAEAHFGMSSTVLMSAVVNAGTAQVIGLGMITTGAAWPLVVATAFVVNLRHVFYSAKLADHVRSLPLPWRVVLAFGLTDQIYALAERRYASRSGGRFKHWYFLASAYVLYASWLASTFVGYLYGVQLADVGTLGPDFAVYAVFVALAVGSFTTSRTLAVGVVAGVLALAFHAIPYQGGLVLAILTSLAIALVMERRERGPSYETGG